MRILVIFIVLLGGGVGAAWYLAGRAAGPVITIAQPSKVVGQTGELLVEVDAPDGKLVRLDILIEQNGQRLPLFSLSDNGSAQLTQESKDRTRVTRAIGKRQIPALETGTARIIVTAVRPVLFGYREAQSTASREVEIRLTPPQIAVQSTRHYINHGGTEMVVYRVIPADAVSGVRVGDHEYLGFPASGAGLESTDPGLRVAFFALLWDQDRATPIDIFARDELGNEGHATFEYQVFPKVFRNSRIPIDDRFLSKVVPAILQNTPTLRVENPADLLASFLRINRDLRRENNATIAALARQTAPEILWQGPFKQLVNSAVEAGFADRRTYVYKGQDIDQQTHLGFDLASTSFAPIRAANHGKVLYAGWLGIYGNCVILDHGLGLQSLYAHLSSIDVKVGDVVDTEQQLGRSGSTGMSGGDHLHFTLLLAGNAITPIDWWSTQWVNDRIIRKLREADTSGTQSSSTE